MPRPAKKKGGRVTAKIEERCQRRSQHLGKPVPHKFSSRRRFRKKGHEEFGEWEEFCSWCCRKKP